MAKASSGSLTQFQEVHRLIAERLPEPRRSWADALLEQFYARTEAREIAHLATEDLYGSVLCLTDLIARRNPQGPLIHLYNPNADDHRWRSHHSVIEVLTDDKPFLVSSISIALNRAGHRVHRVYHPVIRARRDGEGKLIAIGDHPDAVAEALMRFEIDRLEDEDLQQQARDQVRNALAEVDAAVSDFPAMLERLEEVIHKLANCAALPNSKSNLEAIEFLRWLRQDNFVFLGSRHYQLVQEPDGERALVYSQGSGLGIFRQISKEMERIRLSSEQHKLARQKELLVITKSTTRSPIQRPAYLDFIGVREFSDQGEVTGEWRFFGLYASNAYTAPIHTIPLLRLKVDELQRRSGLSPHSHSGKILRHLIHTYPRDEMFQASTDQLEETLMGMLACEERRQLRVFVRPDTYGRFINALILLPRDNYHSDLLHRIEAILLETFSGTSADHNVALTDHALAQIQFTIHCEDADEKQVDIPALEAELAEAVASWEDRLLEALTERLGETEANRLHVRFTPLLPAAYRADYDPRRAVTDLQRMAALEENGISTYLYRPLEHPDRLHFKVLGRGESLALSDVLPVLEQMGVRVLNARPYQLRDRRQQQFWILDFQLSAVGSFDAEESNLREQFQETFVRACRGEVENDGFNSLVLAAGLSYRQVVVLRALCKYLLQLGVTFSQSYMERTLFANPHICRLLIRLFETRFDPDYRKDREARTQALNGQIEEALEAVNNLDEDRILRHFLSIIHAMVRTNYYQTLDGQPKPYLSFKLATGRIPAAPEPRPLFEIFVYSPRVEAVHLRGGKVARGGLRWSDRREDFRTEVLGLVKAQLVKNAVIVPVGAKGGFVCKQLPVERERIQEEVVRCYQTFIRGLLDLTDNLAGDSVVPPTDVVRHDEDDPYLVVAADKGTATFSDIANAVSAEYGFWLGDAFASGGAHGYDHKKMGITARGAWESVKRLFHEIGIDCQRQPFTAIGIGDMSGDVFGNGMLLSRKLKLIAAFNHQHIFIDPDPDPEASYEERRRLFALPRSSWADYDPKVLSAGGGIYPRSAKSITLSEEARRALDITKRRLTPAELIQAILRAPADLLWNGGIGTYVKASDESHVDVGDRANDTIRINGKELRIRVVGEGGNLGFTQRGRIEFARQGGLINTDAIDNSGGVDSSDHEVNIKILLDREVHSQDLTLKQRNRLLAAMTDEVARLVLLHNRQQSLLLSLCNAQAPALVNDHRHLIQVLEREGRLNRALEHLPSDEQMDELARQGQGLSRPEIAVLVAYSKLRCFDRLTATEIEQDPDLSSELPRYFPQPIREQYEDQIRQHPLRREILATHLTNLVVNRMGSTYLTYLEDEARATATDAVRAFFAAREILGVNPLWSLLEAREAELDEALFLGEMLRIQHALERVALWLLRAHTRPLSVSALVERFAEGVNRVADTLPAEQASMERLEPLAGPDTEPELLRRLVLLERLYYGLDMTRLAEWTRVPVEQAAEAYLAMESALGIEALRAQIARLPDTDIWSRKARASLADELDRALVRAAERLLNHTPADLALDARITLWETEQVQFLTHFRALCDQIETSGQPSLAMLSVAVREMGQFN